MSYKVNAFPILKDRVNLTSGLVYGAVVCITDGSLDIVWEDSSTATIDMIAGDAIDVGNAKTATITSGKFHSA